MHLIIQGEQHKKQRKMLNPVFSLANMRDLLPIIQPIADKLCGILYSQLPSDNCTFFTITYTYFSLK